MSYDNSLLLESSRCLGNHRKVNGSILLGLEFPTVRHHQPEASLSTQLWGKRREKEWGGGGGGRSPDMDYEIFFKF